MTDRALKAEPKPGSFAAWMACIRPKTLGIAIAPVAVGLSVSAAVTHTFDVFTAIATLLLSILMQSISNMENDAGYTKKKAERSSRKGLPRATANGWLTVDEVERMIKIFAGVVLLDTAYLIWQGGWIMLIISLASVAAAYAYMGGPKPIAYTPFGELVVFIFFGPVAVCGTYWLQTQTMSLEPVLAGSALGAIAAAVLAVNNFRDWAHDQEVGRRTLAVVIGPKAMARLYCLMLLAGFALIAVQITFNLSLVTAAVVVVCLPRAVKLIGDLPRKSGNELNAVMFGTIQLELLFALMLTIGYILSLFLPALI